jgi:hypothetical protein
VALLCASLHARPSKRFPFLHPASASALNHLALHPHLLRAVQALLCCDDVLLTQCEVWSKSRHAQDSESPYCNSDQRMHMDWPNHYLTCPPQWDSPDTVALLVYLDELCGGETAVVPRSGPHDPAYRLPYEMPGTGLLPWINDAAKAEAMVAATDPALAQSRQDLYRREVSVPYRCGTVLVYRHDVWHRGTPVTSERERAVVNLSFKKASARHVTGWHEGWAKVMYNMPFLSALPPATSLLGALLVSLAPEQRQILGFPPAGDAYWTADVLRHMQARFPGFAVEPYVRASKGKL